MYTFWRIHNNPINKQTKLSDKEAPPSPVVISLSDPSRTSENPSSSSSASFSSLADADGRDAVPILALGLEVINNP